MKNEQKEFEGILNLENVSTIDIHTKVWRDRVNGNSYGASRVVFNYGTESALTLCVPFSYEYENTYFGLARFLTDGEECCLHRVAQDHGIFVREYSEKARKRDAEAWGKGYDRIPLDYRH